MPSEFPTFDEGADADRFASRPVLTSALDDNQLTQQTIDAARGLYPRDDRWAPLRLTLGVVE